ncbi:MAG TPA: DUF4124 domain-containing protein [Rhodanobacteraceae bacterium]|nr:DUF4124 domain-containing protein [Rhodanobacteraceae bacterium]
MPRLLVSAVLAVAALAACASASAQVYKWKDANGTTHYSDVPPPTGSKYQKVNVSSSVATTVAPAPASTAVAADASAKTAAPASASTARVPDTADNRAKLCKQLDSNIALLNSDQPLTSGDASTPQQNMSDVQRRQELATAQAQKKQYCSS